MRHYLIVLFFLWSLIFLEVFYLFSISTLEFFRFMEDRQFFLNDRIEELEECTVTEIPFDLEDFFSYPDFF